MRVSLIFSMVRLPCHVAFPKAGQGSRTPRRYRDYHARLNLRQVLECDRPCGAFRH